MIYQCTTVYCSITLIYKTKRRLPINFPSSPFLVLRCIYVRKLYMNFVPKAEDVDPLLKKDTLCMKLTSANKHLT